MSLGIRCKFLSWNVDGILKSENPITITMDANLTATAHYILQYHLTVQTDPAGIATISGEGWYDALRNVTLSAVHVVGYDFERWDVDGAYFAVGVKTITVFMDRPHMATAHYYSRVGAGMSRMVLLAVVLAFAYNNCSTCFVAIPQKKTRKD